MSPTTSPLRRRGAKWTKWRKHDRGTDGRTDGNGAKAGRESPTDAGIGSPIHSISSHRKGGRICVHGGGRNSCFTLEAKRCLLCELYVYFSLPLLLLLPFLLLWRHIRGSNEAESWRGKREKEEEEGKIPSSWVSVRRSVSLYSQDPLLPFLLSFPSAAPEGPNTPPLAPEQTNRLDPP